MPAASTRRHIATGVRHIERAISPSGAPVIGLYLFMAYGRLLRSMEQGIAPEKTQTVSGARGASGLMCSWPEYPHYTGGAQDQAAGYRCQK